MADEENSPEEVLQADKTPEVDVDNAPTAPEEEAPVEGAQAEEEDVEASVPLEGAPAEIKDETVKTPDEEPPAETEISVEPVSEEAPPKASSAVVAATVEKPAKKGKKGEVETRLFDSQGSLMETESFVREKLEEFKEKKAAVAVLIRDLQKKVEEFREKANPTDDDVANLKMYHSEFLKKLSEYEEMTRNIERLMGMADIPTSQLDMKMSGPPMSKHPPVMVTPAPEKPQRKVEEDAFPLDKLPQVIVCGTDMGGLPRLIVCQPPRKADLEPFSKSSPRTEGVGAGGAAEGGEVMGKLNECFESQQKLVAENAQMAQMRHQLQNELLDKQEILDNMKQQMMTMESEKYRIMKENEELQRRLLRSQGQPPGTGSPPMCKRELYMMYRGQPHEAGPPQQQPCCQREANRDLEQELEKIGDDVKDICCELDNNQQLKLSLGYSTSLRKPVCKRMLPQKSTQTDEDKEKDIFFESDKDPKYKDLREQYQRLHSDFKNKVTEVAALRVALEKTRTELDEITILHHELEEMHQKELDQNSALASEAHLIQSYKEQIFDLESQVSHAKQMYKGSQEEMDELRALIEDQATQLDGYRNKYMTTLQLAEELKNQNEYKERECSDQIAVEIERVKNEMQEQLEELRPIKDVLKVTQQKLKETEQMHTIALESVADLSQKLDDALQANQNMAAKMVEAENDGNLQENVQYSLEMAEKRMTELENDNSNLKDVVSQLKALQESQNQRLEEKGHEVLQLVTQLETLREESARQVSRVKERSEMMRNCLQKQIAEMEREVAQCRAATSFANRERDEIRSKLQLEICLLSENFRESQNRIIQLQQHVNYLSASHPTSFIDLVQ